MLALKEDIEEDGFGAEGVHGLPGFGNVTGRHDLKPGALQVFFVNEEGLAIIFDNQNRPPAGIKFTIHLGDRDDFGLSLEGNWNYDRERGANADFTFDMNV